MCLVLFIYLQYNIRIFKKCGQGFFPGICKMVMSLAYFRFYEELNDFLPSEKQKKLFPYVFNGNPSVKDAIEAMGVPHVEVDLILVNSLPVDFSYILKNEDSVSVYPVFESFDIASVSHLREKPLRDVKFVADVHMGKLARDCDCGCFRYLLQHRL